MEKGIVLVAGMSGAGKSTTMSILEDMGYQCMDQLPSALIPQLIAWLKDNEDPRYKNVALSTSMIDLSQMSHLLSDMQVAYRSILLDASDEQILLRYKFTKHKHPLLLANMATTLDEAIKKERDMYDHIELNGVIRIDTTNLNHLQLKKKIEESFKIGYASTLSISFVSFGYKYGILRDADLLFDVRFLPNPYWEPGLKDLTGNDDEVYHYVIDNAQTQEYIRYLCGYLNYVFSQHIQEGRNHLTIGIGCTGGQHRSIAIVRYLYNRYQAQYNCFKENRNLKERGL